MPYDVNADPNQVNQAAQADQATTTAPDALTPATRGRFAMGFGARAKTRGGLGQKAMDASRMFWEDQPREPDPTKSNFGGGSAVGYQKQDAPDLTPPGYQLAHFVDMMGTRHDYLQNIANPQDMSYLNDKYMAPKDDKKETYPEDKTVPAATPPVAAPPASTPVAPATPAPVPAMGAGGGAPDVVPATRTTETLSTPLALNKPAVPGPAPSDPVRIAPALGTTTWGPMTPTKTVPYGTPESVPAVVPPPTATQASGWGTPAPGTPLTGPDAGQTGAAAGTPTQAAGWTGLPAPRLTGPTIASDVTVKEDITPVSAPDVDAFLRAITKTK